LKSLLYCLRFLLMIIVSNRHDQSLTPGPDFGDHLIGAAIALMQTLRVVHPPAGANPLVVMMAGVHNWEFLITPVLAGSVVLVVIALFINNVGRDKEWPHYWV
ncbi:HPP family protein, partial [Chromohalobacter beijerinckii]